MLFATTFTSRELPAGVTNNPTSMRSSRRATASQAELRLAYRLRDLELRTACADRHDLVAIEHAFNILAEPELRACYDVLLKDPETPVLFPYGGFGSLLVEGVRSRDGRTFFVRRILAFTPVLYERGFDARLWKFQFFPDRAIYRDARRKVEIVADQAAMPLVWEPTWNQWKHLLDAKVSVRATFLQTGVRRMKDGECSLVTWEKALAGSLSEIGSLYGESTTNGFRFACNLLILRWEFLFSDPLLGFRTVSPVVAPVPVLLVVTVFAAVTLFVNMDVVQGYPKNACPSSIEQ